MVEKELILLDFAEINEYFKSFNEKDSLVHYSADSTGGMKKATIYLTDADSADLITSIANLAKPDQSKIIILID